jgi:hypothetical protein
MLIGLVCCSYLVEIYFGPQKIIPRQHFIMEYKENWSWELAREETPYYLHQME